jgi:SAM-dependent methyltransferase
MNGFPSSLEENLFKFVKLHNLLIYSLIYPALKKALRTYACGEMLDIGCGIKPYQAMAQGYVHRHVGLDHLQSLHGMHNVDLVGSAYKLPVNDNTFDTVLCTDVLEHLEEPTVAIAEANRILRRGGYAIYSVPLFWHLHEEPRDFYRFTKYGLKYLFEKNSFDVVEITALSGFFITFGQELVYFLQGFRRGGMLNPLWWLIPPIGIVIQALAWLIGKIEHSERFTVEYLVVARKP